MHDRRTGLGSRSRRAHAAASLAGLALVALAGRARGGELAFEDMARRFLQAHGLSGEGGEAPSVGEVLERAFVRGRFGLFEVSFPAEALAAHPARLKDSVVALLDAQERWLDWMEPVIGKPKEAAKDLETLQRWVDHWKVGAGQGFAKVRDAAGLDLFALAEAREAEIAAGERFAAFMASGAAAGVERAQADPARLCLAPTRKDFVELLALAGYAQPDTRSVYWQDGMADWAMGFVGDLQVVALEYAAVNRPKGVYEQGEGMNERSPTGMQEQVVQLAMNGLCEQYFGPRAPKAFSQGLAMNLVIDLYQEIVTRVDGDLRANRTMDIEVFVPGGASEGGMMPGLSAESRWRELQGSDHFVSVLRLAQVEGARNSDRTARNREDCFALRSDDGGDIHVLCAPMLGSAAAEREAPPERFRGDHQEFLRAYKAGFMYWLREHALRKDAEERFARLLQRLSDASDAGFEAAFAELYDGSPLSAREVSDETLEGRFLAWLSKQK